MKKWYQDWRSWLTIILILFVPTFLVGIIFMWWQAPWSKRSKWWVTGIGLGIPLFGILISLLLVMASPRKPLSQAGDVARRASIQQLASAANKFCLDKNRCPSSLLELQQAGYVGDIPLDPTTKEEYSYQQTNNGIDCMIEATLSTGEKFTRYCVSQTVP